MIAIFILGCVVDKLASCVEMRGEGRVLSFSSSTWGGDTCTCVAEAMKEPKAPEPPVVLAPVRPIWLEEP